MNVGSYYWERCEQRWALLNMPMCCSVFQWIASNLLSLRTLHLWLAKIGTGRQSRSAKCVHWLQWRSLLKILHITDQTSCIDSSGTHPWMWSHYENMTQWTTLDLDLKISTHDHLPSVRSDNTAINAIVCIFYIVKNMLWHRMASYILYDSKTFCICPPAMLAL